MDNEHINQILNNFKKISKLYIKVSPKNISDINFFTVSKEDLEISDTPLSPPYYYNDPLKIFSMIFYNKKISELNLHIGNIKYTLNKKELSFIIGYLYHLNDPHTSFEKAFQKANFHLAHYLSSLEKISADKIALVMYELNLLDEAQRITNEIKEDRKTIILSKIYRKRGELKKSLEILSTIKSNEYEIERNLEYAWLHYQTNRFENAYKLFNYYASSLTDEKAYEASTGLLKTMVSSGKYNILEITKVNEKLIKNENFKQLEAKKILSELYMDIKDFIKAKSLIDEIINLEYSSENINKKIQCEFSLGNDEEASGLLFENILFEDDNTIKILNEISSKRIKIYYRNFVVEETKEKQEAFFEAMLKPEDITKTQFKNIPKTENLQTELLASNYEIKENEEDDISSLAFSFSKKLEEEFNKKIYFNYEGIDDIERKLRLTTMVEISEVEKEDVFKNSSAFIMFFIKERFKAKILKYSDLDMWAWPCIIKNKHNFELITYPAARVYLALWQNSLPEQGWLRKYIAYLNEFMNQKEEILSGKEAIINKIKSNANKIFDAQIEHKKILLISKDLDETKFIPLNISALSKFETEIKKRFKPQTPLTTDGWKILRCYAHIFLEMLIKEFHLEWFNVEKNDGLWSFKISEDTYIFPVGKIYKSTFTGESLTEYYEIIKRNLRRK